jgi:hypothetical protein
MGITEDILSSSASAASQQPSGGGEINVPPSKTTASGAESSILMRTPGPYNPTQGSTCVPRGQMMQRLQLRSYQGQPSAVPVPIGANYNMAYVFGDVVPANRYWIVIECSVLFQQPGGGSGSGWPALFMVPSNLININLNAPADYQEIPLFTSTTAVANGQPVSPLAIRVDDIPFIQDQGEGTPPQEYKMIAGRKLFVPQGYGLAAYSGGQGGNNSGGNENTSLLLKIMFAEMNLNEYTEDSL